MRFIYLCLSLLFSYSAFANGLSVSFSGSRLTGMTRSETIAEYDSTVDHSGNLVDKSGSNYITYSNAFDSWTTTRSSVSANLYRNPLDNAKDVDALLEDGTAANSHYVYNTYSTTSGVKYTFAVYVNPSYRTWVYLAVNTDAASAYFNLSTGVAGTTASNTEATIHRVKNQWYRCAVTWTSGTTGSQQFQIYAAEGDGDITFDGTLGREDLTLYGAQINIVDSWRPKLSIYEPTTSVIKPLHDLAPTLSPTESKSSFQSSEGRRLRARTFSGTNFYGKAHHDSMNIFDGDFTITAVVARSASATSLRILGHSNTNVGGCGLSWASSSPSAVNLVCDKLTGGGASVSVSSPASTAVNYYYVIQAVRRSNIAKVGVDGVFGSPVNVTGYGEDAALLLYVGRDTPGVLFEGSILYARVDARGLTDIELAKDRETIWGTLLSSGNVNPGSTFARTSAASTKYSDGTIGYVGANIPRVNNEGGGILIEESRQNKVLQSQTFGTTWTQVALTSISSDGAQAPDLTTTADGLVGTAVDTLHGVTQDVTLTAAVWSVSVFAKPGNKNWIYVSDDTVANAYVYYNINNCTSGTAGVGVVTYRTEQYANGWCRVFFSVTGTAAAHTLKIASANADADNDFAGDAATVNTWLWGVQVELGAFYTSYVATTSAAATRTADSFIVEPWRLSKNVAVDNPMYVMYFDNDVYSTSTYASEVGNYSFTVNGGTKHTESQTLNDYFSFDGSGDYLSLANGSGGSDFNLASSGANASFSVVAIVTPGTVSGTQYIIDKGYTAGSIGWGVYLSNQTLVAVVSSDGTATTTNATGNLMVSDKTSLITATYTYSGAGSINASNIYVDGNAVVTSNTMAGPVYGSTEGVSIGATSTGVSAFSGKIHYLAFYKGTVITQAQHTAMYASLKEANILPVKIGNSYEHKKLYVNYDAKCAFKNLTEAASTANGTQFLLSISGNTGTASSSKNYFYDFYNGANGRFYNYFYGNDDATLHYAYTGVSTTADAWKNHKVFFDFGDMTKNYQYLDDASSTMTNNTGTENFDLTNTRIRLEQNASGATLGGCQIKNLRIWSAP